MVTLSPRKRANALIEAERTRQIEIEGWSIDHDDQHTDGSIFKAALAYFRFDPRLHNPNVPSAGWPSSWSNDWWKPRTRRENLIRAGALCLAEIERLRRLRGRRLRLRTGHRVQVGHVEAKLSAITEALIALEESNVAA